MRRRRRPTWPRALDGTGPEPARSHRPTSRRETSATYTRRRLLVSGVLGAVPFALWATQRSNRRPSAATAGAGARPPSTPVPVASTPDVAGPATTVAPPRIRRDVLPGAVSDDVALVQARLIELGFDPGPVDGYFGDATVRAVWAFQKLVLGIDRTEATGVVTAQQWDRLADAAPPRPRRPTNADTNHTEIYLPEQVIAVFHHDVPVLVSHISSGELDEHGQPAEWCEVVTIDIDEHGNPLHEPVERDVCGISKTPGGVFEYARLVEGIRQGALGSMWNPVYFNYGIAVHGSSNVPDRPASHGCVRIPMHIADYFQDLVAIGDRVLVWNGEQQPEDLSEDDSLPVFDYPNPDATTTTTTTTSTTTSTVATPARSP